MMIIYRNHMLSSYMIIIRGAPHPLGKAWARGQMSSSNLSLTDSDRLRWCLTFVLGTLPSFWVSQVTSCHVFLQVWGGVLCARVGHFLLAVLPYSQASARVSRSQTTKYLFAAGVLPSLCSAAVCPKSTGCGILIHTLCSGCEAVTVSSLGVVCGGK